jgi:hypothetical protein
VQNPLQTEPPYRSVRHGQAVPCRTKWQSATGGMPVFTGFGNKYPNKKET